MIFRIFGVALDPLTYGNVVKILSELNEFDHFLFGGEALLSALPALHGGAARAAQGHGGGPPRRRRRRGGRLAGQLAGALPARVRRRAKW